MHYFLKNSTVKPPGTGAGELREDVSYYRKIRKFKKSCCTARYSSLCIVEKKGASFDVSHLIKLIWKYMHREK